jgi:hypothetical protein
MTTMILPQSQPANSLMESQPENSLMAMVRDNAQKKKIAEEEISSVQKPFNGMLADPSQKPEDTNIFKKTKVHGGSIVTFDVADLFNAQKKNPEALRKDFNAVMAKPAPFQNPAPAPAPALSQAPATMVEADQIIEVPAPAPADTPALSQAPATMVEADQIIMEPKAAHADSIHIDVPAPRTGPY